MVHEVSGFACAIAIVGCLPAVRINHKAGLFVFKNGTVWIGCLADDKKSEPTMTVVRFVNLKNRCECQRHEVGKDGRGRFSLSLRDRLGKEWRFCMRRNRWHIQTAVFCVSTLYLLCRK